jgi:hypothetical protein
MQRAAGNRATQQLLAAPPAGQSSGGQPDTEHAADAARHLNDGWQRLTGDADAASADIEGRAQAAEARAADTGFVATLRDGWTGVSAAASSLTQAATGFVGQALGGLFSGLARVRESVAAMNPDGVEAAWGDVAGAASNAAQSTQANTARTTTRLSGLWTALGGRFGSVMDRASRTAAAGASAVRGAAGTAVTRLSLTFQHLGNLLPSLPGGGWLQGALGRLLSSARGLWSSLTGRWDGLRARITALGGAAAERVSAAWQGARAAAMSAYQGVSATWARVRSGAGQALDRLTGGVRATWQRIRGFSITALVGKLRRHVALIGSVQQALADPESTMEPYAAPVADTLTKGMPAAAEQAAHEHAPAPPVAPAVAAVQRLHTAPAPPVARDTATFGEIWAGLKAAWAEKWAKVDVKKMVLDTLKSIVWPWPRIGEEIIGIGTDCRATAAGLFSPRSLAGDPLGSLHDLWTNLLHLLDFPLVLWRRVNNIALLLLGPLTLVFMVMGAIGGATVGSVFGAILGALAGLGIGAAPGAGGGLALGGVAGAGTGFGVAMALGQAFLISFAAGEASAFVKALLDLRTARQTREEKAEDFGTAADSSLALGITLVLVGLGWLGGRIAGAVAAVIRRFVPRSVLAVIDDFARGARSARGEVVDSDESSVGSQEAVPGKLRLQSRLRNVQQGAEVLRGRLDAIGPDARPDLRARIDALDTRMAQLEMEANAATDPAAIRSIEVDLKIELKKVTDLSIEVGRAAGETGPYAHLTDRTVIGPDRDFTGPQKTKIREANRARNGGILKSDEPLDPYQVLSDPQKSLGGTDMDPAAAQVDHIVPQKPNGTNSYGNARVVSFAWNQLKR